MDACIFACGFAFDLRSRCVSIQTYKEPLEQKDSTHMYLDPQKSPLTRDPLHIGITNELSLGLQVNATLATNMPQTSCLSRNICVQLSIAEVIGRLHKQFIKS